MADVAAEQASSGHQPEKRKRGRPRKLKPDQSEEPKPKRARGRPKGSKNKKPSKFQEILRPVKHKALLKGQKIKTVSKKSQHKWSKRIIHDLHANPTQLENVQTDSSNNPKRVNNKFANSKNNSLKKMKNSLMPQISSRGQKNKTVSKKSQHKWSKRIIHDLHANPTQLQNVQTDSSNNPKRVNNKFANSRNNSLKKMKNSVMPQISSKLKVNQSSVISNYSKKRTELTDSRKIKTSTNSKCQVHKKHDSTKLNSKSIHFPNNQGQKILPSPKNSAIMNQLQSPVNYRRKSCGLCDQASVHRHKVTSKRFCNEPSSYKSRSLPALRRSQRIRTICDKFSNSTINSENSSPSSAVYYSSPGSLVPLRRRRYSRAAHSPHRQLQNVSQPCSSHHSHAAVDSTTSLSSHTTGATTTTTITTTTTSGLSSPATAPLSSTTFSSPSSVLSASTNNLHHLSSLPSQSTPKNFPFECQADGFTSANQSKDMTGAMHIVRSCGQLPPNNCSMKMLKCHRMRHMAAGSGDMAATSVVCRHHCSAARHLDDKCHNMHMSTQPCLPNIRSAVQVAASMISSRITDNSVSIYNHALGKQSGSVCQSYEQLNIVLSPFERQIFELHQQEHQQRMAMEEERHQMKMDLMRLKKKALESKLKLKN